MICNADDLGFPGLENAVSCYRSFPVQFSNVNLIHGWVWDELGYLLAKYLK